MKNTSEKIEIIKSQVPIGVRNNNPLNIRVSNNQWQGKIATSNAFENFIELKFGIRAAVKNLQTYYNRDKLRSVFLVVSKWAPPKENNTKNYIDFVAKKMGVNPNDTLKYDSKTFSKLVNAMSIIELGATHAVSEDKIQEVIKEFKLF